MRALRHFDGFAAATRGRGCWPSCATTAFEWRGARRRTNGRGRRHHGRRRARRLERRAAPIRRRWRSARGREARARGAGAAAGRVPRGPGAARTRGDGLPRHRAHHRRADRHGDVAALARATQAGACSPDGRCPARRAARAWAAAKAPPDARMERGVGHGVSGATARPGVPLARFRGGFDERTQTRRSCHNAARGRFRAFTAQFGRSAKARSTHTSGGSPPASLRRRQMDCNEARPLLDANADHELPAPDARRVQQHIESCDACRRESESLRGVAGALRAATLSSRAAVAARRIRCRIARRRRRSRTRRRREPHEAP